MKETGEEINKEIVIDQSESDKIKESDLSDALDSDESLGDDDTLEFKEFEKNRFGFFKSKKPKKTESQKIKERVIKVRKKEKILSFIARFKGFLLSKNTYANLSVILDYLLNVAAVSALIISVCFTLYFISELNPIMVVVCCLVDWMMIQVNEKI